MSGIIDHRPYNYGHGIISQNCFAKEYSDAGSVSRLSVGTFVQVHSIQNDNVLFCIVRDDMQVDMNQLLCKTADIISVPENLWGPLFTVKKAERLSLVKDIKVAESIGNISVGHTVQVLGSDNSVICIGKVSFKSSIGQLGHGIYFGLQVLSNEKNLQTIVEKISLLKPNTKGFPRGCDIVVSIDKIRPYKEKPFRSHDKEYQKQLVKSLSSGEDIYSGNFKSMIAYNIKDKYSMSCKKDRRPSSPDMEVNWNHSCLKKMINSDNPLNVGDEVIYLDDDSPERGVVKWIGLIENSLKVGVEFDNPIGQGTGTVEGLGELFRAKYQHALIVPPMALIKLSDYLMNTSKEATHIKKNFNNNNENNINNNLKTNNNNNNNSINNNDDFLKSNEFCCDGKPSAEELYKKSKKVSVSHQCLKHSEKIFESNDCCQIINKAEVLDEKDLSKDGHKFGGAFALEMHRSSKSFDFSKPSEKNMSYRRNCSSVDNGLMQKELNVCMKFQNSKSSSRWDHSGHDLCDLLGTKQERTRHSLCYGEKKLLKCPNEEDDLVFHRSVFAHSGDKNLTTFDVKEGICSNSLVHRMTSFDDSYIPVPVLEQSLLAKKCNHRSDLDGDVLYDVPPSAIRRASCFDKSLFYCKEPCTVSTKDLYKEDFYMGRRHTLAPIDFRSEVNNVIKHQKDKWDSENSSSDENLANFCDSSKPSYSDSFIPEDLGKGSVVELTYKGEPHYGVIRWIGTFTDEREDCPPRLIAGIEMEEECHGFTDGTFNNKRYFHCNPRKALFVPLSKCRKDSRFLEESQKQSLTSKVNYGQIDCPIVEGTIPPINRKNDIDSICGKNRGIQGHHNSCYLDATLFSMFAFTSVFDSLLYRPPTKNDIPQYSEVQRVLREEIVNPLRKNLYVRADRVMKLRTLLEKLSSVSGLTSEEKDPEEFLNSLLAQILRAEPFLKLSSGQEAFHYQLFVEKDERLVMPSVQQLFEQSFVTSDIKLKQVPSCLIIQMPRFGKSFKMYSKILPPQLLDITDIIENSPRQCTVCGKLAEFECKDCFGQQGIGNGLESISFCKVCLDTAHNHHCRNRHNSRALTVPVEFYELQEHCIIPRLYMELFAVVCIETSHYVAFVKCGSGSDAPWCFFDSMADRKGEQNGYNIPEMVPCPDLPYWLSEDGAKMLKEMRDERQLPEHAKRLFSDAYMCMYQSPDLMMYR